MLPSGTGLSPDMEQAVTGRSCRRLQTCCTYVTAGYSVARPQGAAEYAYKFQQDPSVQLQLIRAVRDLPPGSVTKHMVEQLLKEDCFQPCNPRPTKAQKAADATEQHAVAAEAAADQAEQHAKKAEDAADDAEADAHRAVQELAALDAAQESGPPSAPPAADYDMVNGLLNAASVAADHAKEAAAAAKDAAQSANHEGEHAVRVAGKFKAAKPHLDSSESSIDSANKSAAAAVEHAERAATAVTTAKVARQRHQQQQQQQQQQQEEDEDADAVGAALDQQLEQHRGARAEPAARSATRRHGGIGADDEVFYEAEGAKRLRITPAWWMDMLQPQYVPAEMGAAGGNGSGSSTSSRQAHVRSLTRRALCGLLSHCPELWTDLNQSLDQVGQVIRPVLSVVGLGVAGSYAPNSVACADDDETVIDSEVAVCREALGLLREGKRQEATAKLNSSAVSAAGVVQLGHDCELDSPFILDATENEDEL